MKEDVDEDHNSHFKDAAILRFNDEFKSVQVANESEFIAEFRRRANDKFWQSLECIQTCVKSRIGLGKHYFKNFKYQVRLPELVDEDCKFDYRQIGKELEI